MTRNDHKWAARRRAEFDRSNGPRRISAAIDARRRINAHRADPSATRAPATGPIDHRFAYLTRSHD
jgi:hypothetical protein